MSAPSPFPISRDPSEGGTAPQRSAWTGRSPRFQFLGIPPKGELIAAFEPLHKKQSSFQFLGIPPKGELEVIMLNNRQKRRARFQFLGIPPKGEQALRTRKAECQPSECFQFLGIPPKGERDITNHHYPYPLDHRRTRSQVLCNCHSYGRTDASCPSRHCTRCRTCCSSGTTSSGCRTG